MLVLGDKQRIQMGAFKIIIENHRCRWDDNIKLDLQEVGCGCMAGSNWLRIGTGGGHL